MEESENHYFPTDLTSWGTLYFLPSGYCNDKMTKYNLYLVYKVII